MPLGRVTYYNRSRGFGFIQPDEGGPTVFFHFTSVMADPETVLGCKVGYELGPNKAYSAKTDPDKSTMAYRVHCV